MSHTYEHILAAFDREIWAIDESKYLAIRRWMRMRAAGQRVSDEEITAVMQAAERPVSRSAASVAILPLFGTITHRANMFSESSGGTSTQAFGKAFAQVVADPNVTAIIIEADSPGGGVSGLSEVADQIYKARGSKPIIGVANTKALSAAYWILSQVDDLVMAPISEVGSIGVFLWLENWAEAYKMEGIQPEIIRYGEHKAEANDWEPLTDETRAYLKSQVNQVGEMFTKAVARGRGVSADVVRADFGQGRGVMSKDAVRLGMADRIATMEETIERVISGRWKAPSRQAADAIEVRMVAMAHPAIETTVHTSAFALDDLVAATAAVSSDPQPTAPPAEAPVPEPDPPPETDMDGFDELARYRVQEWEQSDAERTSA